MNQKKSTELTDQELLDIEKQKKSTSMINAFLIGLVIGIIIYGVAKSNFGFFALIPLFIIYKVLNKPNNNKPPED